MNSINNRLLDVSISDPEISIVLDSGEIPDLETRKSVINRLINVIIINDLFKVSISKNDVLATNANGGVVLYASLKDYSIRDVCFTEISRVTSLIGIKPKQLCRIKSLSIATRK